MAERLVKTGRLVTVFGGSGFLGRYVAQALARRGWRIRIASRRPDRAFHLQPAGRVGQIAAVQANLRYPESVERAVRGADAVINLVGLLAETGTQRFDAVHVEGAHTLAKAAIEAGARHVVHLSAIGADPHGSSQYARTKAHGEAAICEIAPNAIILRPSIIFGPEDGFFNRFAAMARVSPALPLIGGGPTKLQPVFVGDVAEAVALALDGTLTPGAPYELGGPEVRSFREILEFILAVIGRRRLLLPLPFPLATLVAGGTEIATKLSLGLFPAMLAMTRDQVELLRHDNVVSAEAVAQGRTLNGVGIVPESFETFVPTYLYRFRRTGQFAGQRVG